MVVTIEIRYPHSWLISIRSIRIPPYQTWGTNGPGWPTLHDSTRKFQKMLQKYGKSQILIARQTKNAVGRGQDLKILVKVTILQQRYWHQNHMKIAQSKSNFLCVYPLALLVLRPDLDSSQDSRKVSQGIFQKQNKILQRYRRKQFYNFYTQLAT